MSGESLRGPRLATKLVLALVCIAALTLAILLGYLGPRANTGFVDRCDQILDRSTQLMHELASEHARQSRDVIVGVLQHSADDRSRLLEDLPLSLYGNDVERVRDAIRRHDAARNQRMLGNVQVLADEIESRANERIDAEVGIVRTEQAKLSTEFASDLRTGHLVLCGVLGAAMLTLLGLGLYRTIIAPVRALRTAARRVAQGDLTESTPVATGDEVGALAMDFAAMVRQLRESRDALTRLNKDLESEVAKKTSQLLHAEKMASIGTLAGGIAHEFNNLIGGIRGCTVEALATSDDAERKETLEMVVRTADRARGITQQLLRFSRRAIEKVAPTDVAQVVDEALRLVEPEARRCRIAVERAFTGPLVVSGDGDALHQVFVNLFTNAIQAMPRGGTLRVGAEVSAERVAFLVRDTGVGIAQEDLSRVFEPFFTRKDADGDTAQRGTGLGLSVSFGIVAAHGGHLSVVSTLGQGAEFRVELPWQTPS